ncbi:Peroxin-3 [Macleaya cordata]|uniref:Peroxin-3 n=1 Tax=Macleaya cordata TaxID=56857 RepID=A0A200PT26_MACCD|nr:Peroxin-3 [Macleaya cordata]
MHSLRDFWRRHKRKVFVSVGVLGSGYVLYKLYGAHKQRLFDLEKELEVERETNELIKAQLQAHFENIQRIADSTTLPYAIYYLRSRISEDLDLSHLMKRLMQGKGQPNSLTSFEKLELWERLKILSFMKMVLSLWAMTMLSLYIRVQVNILGRHLYIDTARGLGSSLVLEEADQFDRHGQQEFLATADYMSNYGMMQLIPNMEIAATEVLKGKHLKDTFNASILRETIMQILDKFMSKGGPHHWVTYLVPENAVSYKRLMAASSKDLEDTTTLLLPDISKLDQLMIEARFVLSSEDFGNVVEISLRSVVDALMEETGLQSSGGGSTSSSSGTPLAKLLPRLAQMSPLLLEEPSRNRFIQIIRTLPDVELFYTLLYANMPSVP